MRFIAILLTAVLAVKSSVPLAARTWKSKAGNFSVEATLVDTRHGVALLRKADGTVISVSLEKLSADDLHHIDNVFGASIERIRNKATTRSSPAEVPASNGDSGANLQAPSAPLADGEPFKEGPLWPDVPPSGLRYRWQRDLDYPYLFQATVDLGEYVETVQGMVVFQQADEIPPADFSWQIPKEPIGRGSAFVVRPDGYLITSAQLIKNAWRVDVRLGDKSYAARVLALNTRYDLALLRIPATDLQALPLAGIELPRLTDEFYAVCCPEPDAPESEPKLIRGTLAGIIERSGDKVLQMDSGIATGLLGGPLINRRAEVIGVAHADITAGPISDLGLAVPARYVRRILQDKGLQFLERGGHPLEEAALAELVRPSMAKVTAMRRFSSSRDSSQRLLAYTAHWISSVRSKRGFGALPEAIEGFIAEDGELGHVLVDQFGGVCGTTGRKLLPCFLGKPGQLPLEAMSATGEFTWKEESLVLTKLVQPHSQWKYLRPADISILPNYLHIQNYPDLRLHLRQLTEDVYPGTSATVYEISDSREDIVVVKKRFEVQTLGLPAEPSFAQVIGEGTVHFDRASGLPQKIDTTATITHHLESTDVKASVTITCRAAGPVKRRVFLDVSNSINVQMEAWRNEILTAVDNASRTAPEADPDAVLTRVLTDLRAAQHDRRAPSGILSTLAIMTPSDNRRDEVLDLIEPWVREDSGKIDGRAVEAMAVWATEKDLPGIRQLIEESDRSNRWKVLHALGKSRQPAMARELARHLATPADQYAASRALKDMGSVAEAAVIEMLNHEDSRIQSEACLILKEIGGEASIAALGEFLASDPDYRAATKARLALMSLKRKVE